MLSYRNFALVGVSLLSLATPAMAQDAPQGDEEGVSSEIIVQARRKDESVQDVPLVVQAVTGADIQKMQIRQFEDVTKLVPGLQLAANTNGLGTTASMRGVNFDANASGASTTIEFYRNDAVITSGALFQAMYDVGQVEVLRGPQGTLRGRASPSGSITVTTKRPDLSDTGGYVSGLATDAHRWSVNGAVNVPIIQDKLAVRVAGFVGENRGNNIYGLNLVTKAVDKDVYDHNKAIRASVRFDPFDGLLLLDFNYEGIRHVNRGYDQAISFQEVNAAAGASPVKLVASDDLGVGSYPRGVAQTYKVYNWQAQLNLAGQKLTYVGSKTRGVLSANAPQDGAGLFSSSFALAAPNNLFVQTSNNVTEQTTHEVRLQNDERLFGLIDYVAGWMKVNGHSPTIFNNNTGMAYSTTVGGVTSYTLANVAYTGINRYRDDQEQSLFGNATLHLGERIEVSGGVRKIWFKANSGVMTGTWGADPSTYVDNPSNRRCYGMPSIAGCLPTKKATIYSASAKFKVTDDIMTYVSYGTSWRPGNSVIGWRGVTVGSFLNQFLNLPDENSKSWEAGIKTSWLDRRLRLNLSAYKQDFTNYAYRMSSPIIALDAPSATANLAAAFNFVAPVPAKIKGFEAELAFDASDNFNLNATLAFADGKITNGVFPCLDVDKNGVPDTGAAPTAAQLYAAVGNNQIGTCTGNTSPSSQARFSGTFQAEYHQGLNEKTEGYLRGFVQWKGDSDGFSLNAYDQVKAYALLDLFAGVRDPEGAWDVSLFAKNVLNTRRVLTTTDNAMFTNLRAGIPLGGGITSINTTNATNYVGITRNDPREVGVSVRFAIGSR